MSEVSAFDRVCAATRTLMLPDDDLRALTRETKFETDLDAESLEVIELAMAIEEQFGISINDDELARLATIGDVVALIEHKQVAA